MAITTGEAFMPTQQIDFDSARLDDVALVAEVGEPLSDEGLTRVKLTGDGRLIAEQQHGEKEGERYSSELSRENAESILREALKFDWETRFPTRRGLPDEAIVTWHLNVPNGNALTAKVWLRDAEKPGPMAVVLSALRKSLDRMTGGKLYL